MDAEESVFGLFVWAEALERDRVFGLIERFVDAMSGLGLKKERFRLQLRLHDGSHPKFSATSDYKQLELGAGTHYVTLTRARQRPFDVTISSRRHAYLPSVEFELSPAIPSVDRGLEGLVQALLDTVLPAAPLWGTVHLTREIGSTPMSNVFESCVLPPPALLESALGGYGWVTAVSDRLVESRGVTLDWSAFPGDRVIRTADRHVAWSTVGDPRAVSDHRLSDVREFFAPLFPARRVQIIHSAERWNIAPADRVEPGDHETDDVEPVREIVVDPQPESDDATDDRVVRARVVAPRELAELLDDDGSIWSRLEEPDSIQAMAGSLFAAWERVFGKGARSALVSFLATEQRDTPRVPTHAKEPPPLGSQADAVTWSGIAGVMKGLNALFPPVPLSPRRRRGRRLQAAVLSLDDIRQAFDELERRAPDGPLPDELSGWIALMHEANNSDCSILWGVWS